ncbi:MAG TPA: hypothetical protein VEC19_07110 [Usitatibacter sp.]|nr:hypothetical protein [Usitatibacter sp.]
MKAKIAAAMCAALLAPCAWAGAPDAKPVPGCAIPAGVSLDKMAVQVGEVAPRAIEWALGRSREVLEAGRGLDARALALARKVGVREAAKIRIVVVDRIELPSEPMLREAGARVGLSDSADGMTLGYAVVVRSGHERNPRLLSHEFRHVAQYEACGGIAPFLTTHLAHLAQHGYEASPFEADASRHEQREF